MRVEALFLILMLWTILLQQQQQQHQSYRNDYGKAQQLPFHCSGVPTEAGRRGRVAPDGTSKERHLGG